VQLPDGRDEPVMSGLDVRLRVPDAEHPNAVATAGHDRGKAGEVRASGAGETDGDD
jgi:hypothetical protein